MSSLPEILLRSLTLEVNSTNLLFKCLAQALSIGTLFGAKRMKGVSLCVNDKKSVPVVHVSMTRVQCQARMSVGCQGCGVRAAGNYSKLQG
eukprot:16704-Pelagomonas_calceolata.AAC.1